MTSVFGTIYRERIKPRHELKCQEVAGNLGLKKGRVKLELVPSELDRSVFGLAASVVGYGA